MTCNVMGVVIGSILLRWSPGDICFVLQLMTLISSSIHATPMLHYLHHLKLPQHHPLNNL